MVLFTIAIDCSKGSSHSVQGQEVQFTIAIDCSKGSSHSGPGSGGSVKEPVSTSVSLDACMTFSLSETCLAGTETLLFVDSKYPAAVLAIRLEKHFRKLLR